MLFAGMTRSLLVLLLVAAALWDIRKRRIPNSLSAAVMVAGLGSAALGEGWRAALSGLGSAILTVILMWLPWCKGRIGGGDVKLAAAAATWVGLARLPEYLLGTALAGGVVALVCYALSDRRARQEMAGNLKLVAAGVMPEPQLRGGGGRVSVPYSVASAAAALAVVLLRKGW
jgi:prepilin peptidase CpaA